MLWQKIMFEYIDYLLYSKLNNPINGIMVSMFALSVVDRVFEPWSGQNKDWNWYLLHLH